MTSRLLLVAVIAITSCTAAPAPTATQQGDGTPVRGGRLVLGLQTDITTLQPILAGDDGAGSSVRFIYWPMLEREPTTGALSPGLAENFAVSADGKKVTFTLRDGLVWSDGAPITAADYEYYIEATARSKKSIWKSKFEGITGWKDYAQGRDTTIRGIRSSDGGRAIEISLDTTTCRTLEDLNLAPIPRHLFVTQWDSATLDTTTSIDSSRFNLAPPASSGPFVFHELRPGDELITASNDRFFKGKPLLDGLVYKIYSNAAAARNAFLTGETSWFTPPSSDVEYVRQQMGANAREYRIQDKLGYSFIGWNQHSTGAPWLADKRVRQALWYGLDVKTIIDKVEFGYGHAVYANTPASSWAYDGSGLNHYPYDPGRARQLLEAAGAVMASDGTYRWHGQPMRMRIETNTNNPARVLIAQIAQQEYADIGISVLPVIEPFTLLQQRIQPIDPTVDGVVAGWSFLQPDPEPDAFQIWHSSMQGKAGYNFVGMNDPRLDAALAAGRNGPDCSVAARSRAYHTVDLILNEEAPYTFLYQTDTVFFVRSSVVKPDPQPFGGLTGIEKWWIRP